MVDIASQLLENGEDNLQTHREMLNVGQTNQPGLLRAEVDFQRDRLSLRQAENELTHAWALLSSAVGVPGLAESTLTASLEPESAPLDWETALSQVLASSPELQAARQRIRQHQITVQRERVEPIPNLLAGVATIHSSDADTTQTTVNLGFPIPVFDRNQGTVRQAMADLRQSHAELRRLELELRNRLATSFRDYRTAWQKVQDYQSEMLPKAEHAYDLLHNSYKTRRAAWPDVLMAQRFHLQLVSEQITNLRMYRESDVLVRGMLLTGGLQTPPGPVGAGHIDAVAKPR